MSISQRPGYAGAAPLYAWVSLALIGMMFVYSFLNYYHQFPWTTFYQEWGTAVLGVAATPLLLGLDYWRKSEIPRIVLLPIGMLLLVVAQYALGKMPYFGQMLMVALYLMWATLLVMLGARLRETLGLPTVVTALAVFLLLGAELGAFIGMYQHFQWQWSDFVSQRVTAKTSAAVFGNVAQPNHYADYEALGLASLGLLYVRGVLKGWLTALLALPVLFVLPLTGSRELWFFLGWLVALSVLWPGKEPARRPLLYFSVALAAGFALMHLVLQLPWFQVGGGGSTNTVARMFESDVTSVTLRFFHLWPEAVRVFLHNPLLGAGFGEYGWEHFQMGSMLKTAGLPGLYNNAHNIVLDVAAEGGLAGVAILCGTLFAWLRQAVRAPRTAYHWWGYALLGVLGIHSMGEYPLWYTYFLGIAAVLFGMFDDTRFRLGLGRIGLAFIGLTVLLGALSLYQLFTGYRTLERVNNMRAAAGDQQGYYRDMKAGIAVLHGNLLLQPYADMLTSRMIEIDSTDIDYKLELNEKVQRYVPSAEAVYRQALLLAQAGQEDAARAQLERAIWAYPGSYGMAESLLHRLAERDPTRFNALLKFAVQIHEEYRSAVYPQ